MTCSRCGNEAVVKREAAFYCGKCALARDWHEVIQIVQGNTVETASAAGHGVSSPEDLIGSGRQRLEPPVW